MSNPLISWMGLDDGIANIADYHLILDNGPLGMFSLGNGIFSVLVEFMKIAGAVATFFVSILTDPDYMLGGISDFFQSILDWVYGIVSPFAILGLAGSFMIFRAFYGMGKNEDAKAKGLQKYTSRLNNSQFMKRSSGPAGSKELWNELGRGFVLICFFAIIMVNPIHWLNKLIIWVSSISQAVFSGEFGDPNNQFSVNILSELMTFTNFNQTTGECGSTWAQDMADDTQNSLECFGYDKAPSLGGGIIVLMVFSILILGVMAWFTYWCFVRGTFFLFATAMHFFRIPIDIIRMMFGRNVGRGASGRAYREGHEGLKVELDHFRDLMQDMAVYLVFFLVTVFCMNTLPTLLLNVAAGVFGEMFNSDGIAVTMLALITTAVALWFLAKWVRYLSPTKFLSGALWEPEQDTWHEFIEPFKGSDGSFSREQLTTAEGRKALTDAFGSRMLGVEDMSDKIMQNKKVAAMRERMGLDNANSKDDIVLAMQTNDFDDANKVTLDAAKRKKFERTAKMTEKRYNKLKAISEDPEKTMTAAQIKKFSELEKRMGDIAKARTAMSIRDNLMKDGKKYRTLDSESVDTQKVAKALTEGMDKSSNKNFDLEENGKTYYRSGILPMARKIAEAESLDALSDIPDGKMFMDAVRARPEFGYVESDKDAEAKDLISAVKGATTVTALVAAHRAYTAYKTSAAQQASAESKGQPGNPEGKRKAQEAKQDSDATQAAESVKETVQDNVVADKILSELVGIRSTLETRVPAAEMPHDQEFATPRALVESKIDQTAQEAQFTSTISPDQMVSARELLEDNVRITGNLDAFTEALAAGNIPSTDQQVPMMDMLDTIVDQMRGIVVQHSFGDDERARMLNDSFVEPMLQRVTTLRKNQPGMTPEEFSQALKDTLESMRNKIDAEGSVAVFDMVKNSSENQRVAIAAEAFSDNATERQEMEGVIREAREDIEIIDEDTQSTEIVRPRRNLTDYTIVSDGRYGEGDGLGIQDEPETDLVSEQASNDAVPVHSDSVVVYDPSPQDLHMTPQEDGSVVIDDRGVTGFNGQGF